MRGAVTVGDLLAWIVGFWTFMKRYGYVEADMHFEKIWAWPNVQGTAKFATGSEEQE